ncbi:flavin reductase [Acuticoccus sp. M5D2P5]|uniref:flavin reductase n=1 Tax=Acuticoccus kalidii TaxID=2910977 RepID=UPI001F19B5E1|nr:flavin reductase [Acuticoccus kalidii]MCF3932848.1 flavin reductase [Acuticoccus kalidii]
MNEVVRAHEVIDTREMRRALGQFATGVTIVTCLGEEGAPVGMTANSFASVSLDPPLVLWSLDRRARSFAALSQAERFAFSVLSQDQVELSNRFAKPGADKFADIAWRPGLGGVPLLPDPAAHFECTRHAAFDGGDHLIIVGRVERFVRYDRRGLVFAEGRYGAIAPHPGAGGVAVEEEGARHPYDDFLLPLLFRAYSHLFRGFADSLTVEETDGGQMRILSILSAAGPTSIGELLTRTMLSQSRFDDACNVLGRLGYVTSAGAGALAITAQGEAKLAELLRHAAERERESTGSLDATEVEMLRALLRKLVFHHEGER